MVAFLSSKIDFPFAFADQMIYGDTCTRYRPDVIYISPGERVIVVECDEHQHNSQGYTCEEKRMSKISENLSDVPITFIRFNPDTYKHPQEHKTMGLESRYPILQREIELVRNRTREQEEADAFPWIEVIYLFYDQDAPAIAQNIKSKRFVYE